ncbi:MAG: RpiB/LacA/LacB family sugar-phosphate isomerase [Candidatus Paceibacterota bacterium]|jgi:ribose 5-phosphate isomerase B
MQIYLGSDHAGFELKNGIKEYLVSQGFEVVDVGADNLDLNDDYTDYIFPVASAVAKNPRECKGVIFGRSGQGEAMLSNRLSGVRAVVYYGGPIDIVRLSREHNDANIISFGAQFVGLAEAKSAVRLWLGAAFSDDPRYQRRIEKAESLVSHFDKGNWWKKIWK